MKTSRLAIPANSCGAPRRRASASSFPTGNPLGHLAAALCLFSLSPSVGAAGVNLAWNPNPEPDIAGYQLSYGTSSGSRPNTVNTTGAAASVSGLVDGQTYYFAVRAINTAGQQSASSSEISYLVPVSPTQTPPPPPPSALQIPQSG